MHRPTFPNIPDRVGVLGNYPDSLRSRRRGLTLLGYENVAVYDASMSEWAADPSLPMQTGPMQVESWSGDLQP